MCLGIGKVLPGNFIPADLFCFKNWLASRVKISPADYADSADKKISLLKEIICGIREICGRQLTPTASV